jgi:thiol-disulfide isomerase/thioredoxin
MRTVHALLVSALAAAPLAAQHDLAAAQRELDAMFERPAGTTISDAHKQKLAAFLERWSGKELGHLGYAEAMMKYLARDPTAAADLDRFFARHDAIHNAEHAAIAGRIYLASFMSAGLAADRDSEAMALHVERAARLYPDSSMLMRVLPNALAKLSEADATRMRLAFARGVLRSDTEPAKQEGVLRELFAPTGGAVLATPLVRAAGGTREPQDKAAELRAALTGKPAPELDVQHVIGGDESFSLASYRGKVVVLDFTATWCGPCRRIVPDLIAMQKEHRDDVQVVGVTRLYGYATDFSGDVEIPNGGKLVRDLTPDAELAINRTFCKAFGIDYPLVVVTPATAKEHYGVTGIPTVFVVGRDGDVVGHVIGAGEVVHAQLFELVETARQRR